MSIGKFNTDKISRQTTITLCVMIAFVIGISTYSAVCPPPGQIDDSIFKLIAWIFAFASLLVAREAIREGLGLKYTKGDVTIEIDKSDD